MPGRFAAVPASQSSAMNVSGGRLADLPLAVDLVGAGRELEQVAERPDRFGQAQHQEAAGIQREVKHRQQPLLQRRRHVDQHVAAGDEIDARERRIDGDVLAGEHAQVADALLDAVVAILPGEEPAQPLGADLGLDALGIEAGARLVERRRVAEVGGEDLDRRAWSSRCRGTRAAPSRSNRPPGRSSSPAPRRGSACPSALPLTIAGKTCSLQVLEHLRVAKEAGDVDQDVAIQRVGLVAVALEEPGVVARRRESAQQHAPGGAPLDGGVAILAEIDAGAARSAAMTRWNSSGRCRRAVRRVGGVRQARGRGAAAASVSRSAISSGGSTRSTAPLAMALCGMPAAAPTPRPARRSRRRPP